MVPITHFLLFFLGGCINLAIFDPDLPDYRLEKCESIMSGTRGE
jgi:hypothetical protein